MVPLALLYGENRDLVSQPRAQKWAGKAAAAGEPEGHLIMGYLWDKEQLSFDPAESSRNALAEYRQAADRGNCIAMMNIGGGYTSTAAAA